MNSYQIANKSTLVLIGCSDRLKRHLVDQWSIGSTKSLSEPLRVRETQSVLSIAEAIPVLMVNDAVFTDFEHMLTFLAALRHTPTVDVKFVYAYESPAGADWVKFDDLINDRHFSSALTESHTLFYAMLTDGHGRTKAA